MEAMSLTEDATLSLLGELGLLPSAPREEEEVVRGGGGERWVRWRWVRWLRVVVEGAEGADEERWVCERGV